MNWLFKLFRIYKVKFICVYCESPMSKYPSSHSERSKGKLRYECLDKDCHYIQLGNEPQKPSGFKKPINNETRDEWRKWLVDTDYYNKQEEIK